MTELEFLAALRARHASIAMIVFTAETNPHVLHAIAQMPCTGIVSKSDELRDLLDFVIAS